MDRERFETGSREGAEEEYAFLVGANEAGERLDAVLAGRYRWLSRSEAKRVISEGRVSVTRRAPGGEGAAEERVLKGSFRVSPRDRVLLVWPCRPRDQAAAAASPPENEIEVLFEDGVLIAVNKPAGMPVHPAGESFYRTVLFALHSRCRAAGLPAERLPVLAHRLDAETSGVLVAVQGRIESRDLAEQFRRRTVHKEYLAIVHGCPRPAEGTVELPIGPDEKAPVPFAQAVRPDGAPAATRYRVEQSGRLFALVRLFPETGRKHQLRVHLAAIGHPVVGDKRYGPPAPQALLARHALHSSRLALRHPRTGAEVAFEAPLPADMAAVLRRDDV